MIVSSIVLPIERFANSFSQSQMRTLKTIAPPYFDFLIVQERLSGSSVLMGLLNDDVSAVLSISGFQCSWFVLETLHIYFAMLVWRLQHRLLILDGLKPCVDFCSVWHLMMFDSWRRNTRTTFLVVPAPLSYRVDGLFWLSLAGAQRSIRKWYCLPEHLTTAFPGCLAHAQKSTRCRPLTWTVVWFGLSVIAESPTTLLRKPLLRSHDLISVCF